MASATNLTSTQFDKAMDIYEINLIKYRKTNGEPLADGSIKMYFRTVNNYIQKYGLNWKITEIKKNIDEFSTSTKMNYVNSFINYFTVMDYNKKVLKPYLEYRDTLIQQKQSDPQIAPSKKTNLVDWVDILQWLNDVKEENEKTNYSNVGSFQTEVLLSLYTTFPRRNEISELLFYRDTDPVAASVDDETDKDNIIVHYVSAGTMSIIFKNYKTAGTYGKQEFQLPEELYELISLYTEQYKVTDWGNDNVMFRGVRNKEPLSRLNLTKLLQRSSKKYLNKSISTNMIRHSFATSKYAGIKSEIITDAEILAHTPSTLMDTYVVS